MNNFASLLTDKKFFRHRVDGMPTNGTFYAVFKFYQLHVHGSNAVENNETITFYVFDFKVLQTSSSYEKKSTLGRSPDVNLTLIKMNLLIYNIKTNGRSRSIVIFLWPNNIPI